MKVTDLHDWHMTTAQAREIQLRLAGQVSTRDELGPVRLVAGVDISVDSPSGNARGAVVVLSYPQLELVEARIAEGKPGFPYVPGLLSFRECPLILQACRQLVLLPDLILVDGQGMAHPRRIGIACHLGLFLNTPTIGCAKSVLCGQHDALPPQAGSWAEMVDRGEVVGAALRTRDNVAPVYVSIGHKVDLKAAIRWVKQCCRGYRLPEPARLAHLAAGGHVPEGLRQAPEPSGHHSKTLSRTHTCETL